MRVHQESTCIEIPLKYLFKNGNYGKSSRLSKDGPHLSLIQDELCFCGPVCTDYFDKFVITGQMYPPSCQKSREISCFFAVSGGIFYGTFQFWAATWPILTSIAGNGLNLHHK
jgi:hypothetical protein